jgi:uncharacterized membrane protein YczE
MPQTAALVAVAHLITVLLIHTAQELLGKVIVVVLGKVALLSPAAVAAVPVQQEQIAPEMVTQLLVERDLHHQSQALRSTTQVAVVVVATVAAAAQHLVA